MFHESIKKLEAQLAEQPEPQTALVVATSAVKEMEYYSRQIEKTAKSLAVELRAMVNMLTKKVVEISEAGEKASTNLEAIRHQLVKASQIEDVRVLRMRLGEALEELQAETIRQKKTTDGLTRDFQDDMDRLRSKTQRPSPKREIDPVTGLAGQREVRECLLSLLKKGGQHYAAVLSINRLDTINNRYGAGIGDQMFLATSQHFAQRLSAQDHLFRWNGSTLLAMLERSGTLQDVQAEIDRIASARLEKTVKLDQRSILLTVSADSMVIPLSECPTPGLLMKKIDDFCGVVKK
jgi:GGDEF domain-containing protein